MKAIIKNFIMKTKLFLAILLCACVGAVHAQSSHGKNLVKLNALTLLGGKISAEYEYLIRDKMSIGAAVSIRPQNTMPFGSTLKNVIDGEDLDKWIDNFKSSNFSITPEVRFYTSGKRDFRGFYVAPYVKYATYGIQTPIDYELSIHVGGADYTYEERDIPVSGRVNTFTAGVSIGVNFRLSEKFYLDWRMVGPGYGFSKGDLSGRRNLSAEEQEAVGEGLDELKEDLPDIVKMEHEVTSEGAFVDVKGPWAAIRSGLSISYRF